MGRQQGYYLKMRREEKFAPNSLSTLGFWLLLKYNFKKSPNVGVYQYNNIQIW